MRKPKIILDFLRATNAKLETQAGTIIAAMTNNQYFTNPMPSLGEVNTALQQFAAALYASQSRDKNHITQRNQARQKLELELRRLANYVMLIAGDSRPIMVSSGFTVTGATRVRSVLGAVKNFAVTLGENSGEAEMSLDPVENRDAYVFYWALVTNGEVVWKHKAWSAPKLLVTDLLSLQTYMFKVEVVGKRGQAVETIVITKVVL